MSLIPERIAALQRTRPSFIADRPTTVAIVDVFIDEMITLAEHFLQEPRPTVRSENTLEVTIAGTLDEIDDTQDVDVWAEQFWKLGRRRTHDAARALQQSPRPMSSGRLPTCGALGRHRRR